MKLRSPRPIWAQEQIAERRAEEAQAERDERLARNRKAIARAAARGKERAQEAQAEKRAEGKPAKTKANKVREWRSRWRAVGPSELPPITRLLLWEISDHMNWDSGDNAYPAMESIVTGTGLNMTTVRTHRNLAVALGWLRAYPRMKKHGLGLAYQIAFPSHDQKTRAPELVRKALTPKRKRRKAAP